MLKTTNKGCLFLLILMAILYDVITCQSVPPADNNNNTAVHDTAPDVIHKTKKNPRSENDSDRVKNNRIFQMPPFVIGGCCVLVIYAFFHCLYMHCYTEKRVKTIAKRQTMPTPTIIISDDASNGTVKPFTPVVKYDTGNGRTEVVEAQPFLICQPMEEENEPKSVKPKRKGSQLQIPNLLNKLRRASKSSIFSGDSSNDGESPKEDSPLNNDRNIRTRASICFVPMGQSITDPQNGTTDWTPLHGFVYSSFVMSRRPSYKQACTSNESVDEQQQQQQQQQHQIQPSGIQMSRL